MDIPEGVGQKPVTIQNFLDVLIAWFEPTIELEQQLRADAAGVEGVAIYQNLSEFFVWRVLIPAFDTDDATSLQQSFDFIEFLLTRGDRNITDPVKIRVFKRIAAADWLYVVDRYAGPETVRQLNQFKSS